jgi:hypothetical protein
LPLAAWPPYTRAIAFAQEAVYHLAIAAPLPAVLVVLAFVKARRETRVVLLSCSLVLFVLIYVVSYMFFCVGCS